MRSSIILAMLAAAIPAFAQETVVRLTPEQREKVLDDAALHAGAEPVINGLPGRGRQIHGEVGMMIGTGGARGVFGAAAVPLGDRSVATFSYENVRSSRGAFPYANEYCPSDWPIAERLRAC